MIGDRRRRRRAPGPPGRAAAGARRDRPAGPLLDLPTDGAADRIWQYFSTDGFYKIPIGNSTFDIPAVDDLRGGMHGFPDKASVEKLRYYGIQTVVLHLDDAQGTAAASRLRDPRAARTRRPRPPSRSPGWASRAGGSARS